MPLVNVILNILWIITGGLWMAFAWVVAGVVMALTIIGLPFAWAHLKLAGLALWPIGKMVVPVEEADRLYQRPWRRGVL